MVENFKNYLKKLQGINRPGNFRDGCGYFYASPKLMLRRLYTGNSSFLRSKCQLWKIPVTSFVTSHPPFLHRWILLDKLYGGFEFQDAQGLTGFLANFQSWTSVFGTPTQVGVAQYVIAWLRVW